MALDFETASLRSFSGVISLDPPDLVKLETSNDFESESWSFIKQVTFIEDRLRLNKTQKKFVATYLARSNLFYDKYKLIKSDPSSGLLAYYFAMNLAKAFLCAKDFSRCDKNMRHGLKFDPRTKITVKNPQADSINIFPELYREINGEGISNNTPLKIEELVGHIRELYLQQYLLKLGGGSLDIKAVSLVDSDSNDEAWSLIRIHKFDVDTLHKNKTMLRSFNRVFAKVEVAPDDRTKIFRDSAYENRHYIYFQSKKAKIHHGSMAVLETQVNDEIKDAFRGRTEVNIFNPNANYSAHMFLRGKKEVKITELLSAYAMIYWSSSVIRYDPSLTILGDYNSRHRFIYDETIRTCPYLILRYFASLFAGLSVSMVSRT